MTATLESLSRQIRSAEDLASVVRTMKTLAAVSIRQYEEAVESLRDYRRNVEDGLRMLLWDAFAAELPHFPQIAHQPELAVVFGSDQGLCGQFNQQIVTFLTSRFSHRTPPAAEAVRATNADTNADTDPDTDPDTDADTGAVAGGERPVVVAIGHRCASLLEEAGFAVQTCLPEANSIAAVTDCVQDLLTVIDRVRQKRHTGAIALYFSQRITATVTEPRRTRVLPVELHRFAGQWRSHRQSRSLPLWTLPRGELLPSLLREYLFVSLFRACAESLASENAARIQSMQTAERNITDRLRELRGEFHQSRQTAITEELLDVIGGFEVLQRDGDSDDHTDGSAAASASGK